MAESGGGDVESTIYQFENPRIGHAVLINNLAGEIQVEARPRVEPEGRGDQASVRSLVPEEGDARETIATTGSTTPRGEGQEPPRIGSMSRSQPGARPGSQLDVETLEHILAELQFDVHRYNNCTAKDMDEVESWLTTEASHSHTNCLLLVLLSWCSMTGEILDIHDQTGLSIKHLIKSLSQVKSLQGKPKILFLQLVVKGNKDVKFSLTRMDDFYIVCSTMKEESRYPDTGSIFLQTLATQLQEGHMTMTLPKIVETVEKIIEDSTTLTDAALFKMSQKISVLNTHEIGVGYLALDDPVVASLKELHKLKPSQYTYEVLKKWRDKKRDSSRQKLLELLEEAASDGLVNIHDVGKVLAIPPGVPSFPLQEHNFLKKVLNFAFFFSKTDERKLASVVEQLRKDLEKTEVSGEDTTNAKILNVLRELLGYLAETQFNPNRMHQTSPNQIMELQSQMELLLQDNKRLNQQVQVSQTDYQQLQEIMNAGPGVIEGWKTDASQRLDLDPDVPEIQPVQGIGESDEEPEPVLPQWIPFGLVLSAVFNLNLLSCMNVTLLPGCGRVACFGKGKTRRDIEGLYQYLLPRELRGSTGEGSSGFPGESSGSTGEGSGSTGGESRSIGGGSGGGSGFQAVRPRRPPCKHRAFFTYGAVINGTEQLLVFCGECKDMKMMSLDGATEPITVFQSPLVLYRLCQGDTLHTPGEEAQDTQGQGHTQGQHTLYVNAWGNTGMILELNTSTIPFGFVRHVTTAVGVCSGMVYIPDRRSLVTSEYASRDKVVRALSVDTGAIQWVVRGEVDRVQINPRGLVYHPEHGILVGDGWNSRILVLDPSDGFHLQTIPLSRISAVEDLYLYQNKVYIAHSKDGVKLSCFSIEVDQESVPSARRAQTNGENAPPSSPGQSDASPSTPGQSEAPTSTPGPSDGENAPPIENAPSSPSGQSDGQYALPNTPDQPNSETPHQAPRLWRPMFQPPSTPGQSDGPNAPTNTRGQSDAPPSTPGSSDSQNAPPTTPTKSKNKILKIFSGKSKSKEAMPSVD